ncbi:heme exporter protein CcmD [Marinimicrococcus flavescens]|uniref:Heme exporter protein D n=1 Tax=Marinimicrococcus flavescens TaxID=3031815 RepID=A0AAP3XPL1_9PROT|nr:heme exporter protein CcmD [Marinimicrococcus flavescens]
MAAFLAMGSYGGYVWAAFGFTFLVMGTLFWQSWRLARKRTAEVALLREQRQRARPGPRRKLVASRPSDSAAEGAMHPGAGDPLAPRG